jgi:hypothetical protein
MEAEAAGWSNPWIKAGRYLRPRYRVGVPQARMLLALALHLWSVFTVNELRSLP